MTKTFRVPMNATVVIYVEAENADEAAVLAVDEWAPKVEEATFNLDLPAGASIEIHRQQGRITEEPS